MATAVEKRAAVLLGALIEERDTTPAEIAAELGLETAAVERLVGGHEPLQLARLERVLGVLGADPGEFFGRLYAPGPDAPSAGRDRAPADEPAPEAPAEEPINRHEVEAVLGKLRSMIEGMTRMLDSEREAGRSRDDGDG